MGVMDTKISHIIKDLFDVELSVVVTRPEEQFGDYATNVALQLAKPLGKNPRDIADQIAQRLRESGEYDEVSIAGPGFINIRLSTAALIELAQGQALPGRIDRTIVIETNNPNPFKAMHIGHAFNAVLGDTIANLLELTSTRVHRVSYHGDVGLHVGKSMYSLLKYAAGDSARIAAIPEAERNSFMSKMYAAGSKAYKENETAKLEINELARQSFAPESGLYADIYELCKKWSFEQIDATVARLGNKPTVYRFLESAADARGVAVVKANVPGVFQESDGALVFRGSEYGSFDNAFVASNGRGLYAARDLGLMLLKDEQFHPVRSYIVTAEEQRDYFKGVIAAAGLVWPDKKDVTVNISTGTVKLSTGKMSSRDGDVIEISWLFDEFAKAIEERGGQPDDAIIAGALRYQFLKVRIGSDVVFDVSEAVSLTGNTGSYLQYAHARAKSILEKGNIQGNPPIELQEAERRLLRKITEYQAVVAKAAADLMPHYVTTYLYELAQAFNSFYEHNRVIGDEREAERVWLVAQYTSTLRSGLELLGIVAPDVM
jgi:arginyl-tRNA synthetase